MVLLLEREDLGEDHLGSLGRSWGWKDIEHHHHMEGVAADHREGVAADHREEAVDIDYSLEGRIGSICLDRDSDSFYLNKII